MIMMHGCKPMMPFQMVDIVEIFILSPGRGKCREFVGVVQTVFTIKYHVHYKAAKDIKWAQEQKTPQFDRLP